MTHHVHAKSTYFFKKEKERERERERERHAWIFVCDHVLISNKYRACLISHRTLQNSGWYYSQFFILFLHFPITINIKTFSFFFFTFYITSIIFYYYSNKKIHYNTNFFSLFYKNSFYFISHHHFLLISKLTTQYSVLFCSLPNIYHAGLTFVGKKEKRKKEKRIS